MRTDPYPSLVRRFINLRQARWPVVVAAFATWCGMADAASNQITDLAPIPLRSGVNQISSLSADGRPGIIVLGWRDNGNAHGYDVALVLLQSSGGWNVAKVQAPEGDRWGEWQDGIRDDPHTGEDVVRSFRFARGRVDGGPATLLLTATRDDSASILEPSKVTFQAYRLEHAPEVGTTPDHFALVRQDRSSEPSCNAEMALSKRFGLPLRSSYAGPRTDNGCP